MPVFDFCRSHLLTGLGVIVAFFAALIFTLFVLSFWSLHPAHAHDRDGHWAQLSAEGKAPPKEWWDALQSGKGLCCSFADGATVKDVDWDTQRNADAADGEVHYRVRLDGQWIDVPPAAVITEPNKFGPAVVWPYKDTDGAIQIRCFLPGAGA